jgi:membrane-associated protease RseP (regulator of RpoE activity)
MRDQVIGTSVLPGDADDQPQGTIGYELARRTLVVIDYAHHSITFRKPQPIRPPANATAMPFQFAEVSQVLVKAAIDGIAGDFQLDTGMAGALELNRPFAARNGFLARYGDGKQGLTEGIGGVAPVVSFDQSSFTIGKLQPWVHYTIISLAESGSGVQEYVAGTIGNRILQQFTLTLDYGHRTVYFEKNASYGKPDSSDDESVVESFTSNGNPDLQNPNHDGWLGFIKWIRPRNKPIQIVELAPDSPAATAGIIPGDLITEVNGIPVEDLSGEEIARALIAPPGSQVRLIIKRKTEMREFILRTL